MTLFGTDDEDAAARSELSLDAIGDLYPIYPLTKGVESWDLQRAIAFARTVVDDLPELLPESVRRDHDLVDAGTALTWIHAPDTWAQVKRAQLHYRFEEALVTQLVLARRRRFVHALGTLARAGGEGGLARGLRRAAAVHPDRRPAGDRRPDRGRPRRSRIR